MSCKEKLSIQENPYHYYTDNRYAWQDEAVEEIYSVLRKNPMLSSIYRDNINQDKLVITCGIPQCGKTEMLLLLLGIKEKHINSVYNVTRAGQTAGASSTSTAINYHCSITNDYGVYDPSDITNEITYLNEEGIIEKLKQIRNDVEAGTKCIDVLHIYFPKEFFENSDNINFNILDLPGIESSNLREERYVKKIYAKYMPIASVIIVVCRANLVKDFEASSLCKILNLYIPEWKLNDIRFMLVVTGAYSGSSILGKNNIGKHSVEELILISKNKCISETQRHLGNNNMTIYPLDVGDSLRRLDKYHHISKYGDTFIKKIKEECSNTITDIRYEISLRKNHAPLQILNLWAKQVSMLISEAKDELKKNKNNLYFSHERTENDIITYENDIQELCELLEDTEEIKKNTVEFSEEIESFDNAVLSYCNEYISTINSYCNNHGYNGDKRINVDLARFYTRNMYILFSNINSIIPKSKNNTIKIEDSVEIEEYIKQIQKENIFKFQRFGVFELKSNEYRNDIIKKVVDKVHEYLSNTRMLYMNNLDDKIDYLQSLIQSKEDYIIILQRCKENSGDKINKIQMDINELDEEELQIKDILVGQRQYCKLAFTKAKNICIERMNMEEVDDYEKVHNLLLLSILQADYDNLME